ncbi:E3 ubiquitin-protein ligase SH3RF2 isoform X1 [Meriones unguiculatus]|uniref:E3 ubiquitin-protein ligase SH3RF2 isoform X1 n=1 Tax=Meriones unguiculatus TaxID=10047 RepID=UPI000B4F95EA|nr:E3 ubiquitin-protein ligase SH3RF2 isoform X1 [Meriones unguiculatus]XP_021506418.1 putative E3 ubiquitin-protein ligase SH3RF2 isoform X1 [Meriones unguiculatus]XP_060233319.1 E3 ubiquitin-protein ligase SH3RF2 isoform X1 [Meriones unguiculatus]XP_060233320.1 E3 ubiquitin-protein ligase SH3RF2 isoform X1 [Meriones unguiculatus]
MDDLTLLDLLECPVCFEKLDVTAKVLPCQHTFCKPCLQRIFKAHKELRCPECRTLVLCSIEALPANLLLVRLLDGVRSGQSSWRGGSFRRPGILTLQDNRKARSSPRSLQASPFRLVPSVRIHMDGVPRAKALCNYRGKNPGDLKFNKGDVILLRRQLDENWYQGEINGVSGVFPASSVEVIKQLPQPPPLCRALYNFDLRDKNKSEKQDCLTFLKDDIITVTSRVDENWAEGKLGDRVGIFPILFVEPNLTARHLLEKNKGHQLSRTKNLSLMSSPSRGKATNTSSLRKSPGSRRKGSGQSITTALNTLNRMVHSPEGHPMREASIPVLISSSSPSVFTQHGDKADFPASPTGQVSTSHPVPASPGHSTAVISVPSSQQHLSSNMFVALHSYSAHGPDELDLQKGEGIRVLGKYQDGWLKGLSLVTGRTGLFPSNYVIPVFSSTRKTSSFPDFRSPTLLPSWALSTSSVSSQGSLSEGNPQQSQPFKSVFVPTAIAKPERSTPSPGTSGQGSLRKGRSSVRKNGSLQRPVQSGIPAFMVGPLRCSSTMVIQPQKFQLGQPQEMTPVLTPMTVDIGPKPISTGEPALTCINKGAKTRVHSPASSVIMEGKEISIKSEPPVKPPASAPPSILVKPENSKNGTEKQVKTVRFQNYSPPPSKHYTSHATSRKLEQPATLKGSQPEAPPSATGMTVLFAHRSGSHSGQQTDLRRKSSFGKTMTSAPTAAATQTVLPSK